MLRHDVDRVSPVLQSAGVHPRPGQLTGHQLQKVLRVAAGGDAHGRTLRHQVRVREQVRAPRPQPRPQRRERRRPRAGAEDQQVARRRQGNSSGRVAPPPPADYTLAQAAREPFASQRRGQLMRGRRLARWAVLLLGLGGFAVGAADEPKPGIPPTGPRSPKEELATFCAAKGFRVELVAAEPDVVDPVAMAFDEDGRLFVCEMRGYPNEGRGTDPRDPKKPSPIATGRVKLLEDRDGDGIYERCTTFAEGLRFPTSVMPWKGGVIVANAPDLLYLEDTDGDGKADRKRVLYTGFNLDNIQQLVNSLQWGLDNWVYGVAGNAGGTIRSGEKPDAPAVTLRGRGIRFHPETPGSLEPTSGGGQYGLAADARQRWTTHTNS